MSWTPNNNAGGFAPPTGPPGGFGAPPPAGFPSPGFPSGYGGAAPSPFGAPPGPGGFAPPPGQGERSFGPASSYPGAQYHNQYGAPPGPPPNHGSPFGPPSGSPYAPPSGSPYAPPSGSPYGPPSGQHSPYAPPPGPPSGGHTPGYGPPSGPPPGQQWGSQSQNPYAPGSYAPPANAPPHMPPRGVQHYGPSFQGQNNQQQQPFFEYSMCNGKKKALLIGINYTGTSAELRGCINDVQNVKNFLCSSWGYKEQDIVALTDDARNPRQIPTKQNIVDAMQWLVKDARPNDSLFFHYSGHGGQTKDLDGDEDDGYDEVIYPIDFETNGHIVDDDMHAIMVAPLPAGCRLTALFDSCHSGSALDLPYIYSTEGKLKEPNLVAEAGAGLLSAVTSYARGDKTGMFKSVLGIVKTATGSTQKANEYAKRTRTSPADAISFSGCKDSQTSADTVEAGQATGAMSYAFIAAIQKQHDQSYQQLLVNIREILRSKYSQKPQLSSSHPMDTTIQFIM